MLCRISQGLSAVPFISLPIIGIMVFGRPLIESLPNTSAPSVFPCPLVYQGAEKYNEVSQVAGWSWWLSWDKVMRTCYGDQLKAYEVSVKAAKKAYFSAPVASNSLCIAQLFRNLTSLKSHNLAMTWLLVWGLVAYWRFHWFHLVLFWTMSACFPYRMFKGPWWLLSLQPAPWILAPLGWWKPAEKW